MAGKFINTTYKDTVDSIVNIHDDLIKNPFYLFNDKKGTKLRRYYNINMEQTTLDKGSKLSYTDLGSESPIRFNVVYDLFLYQFSKVELNLENGDFGLEGNPITGESYILPNTIEPCEGDFFEVDHINDSTWLFKVTDVQKDTLDNGSNVWKISWLLDRTTNKDILNNVVEEFMYLNVQEGTNIKAVVKLDKYQMAEKLDRLATTLRDYFKDLFYSDKVQTFIYHLYNNSNMYDPFAIEFIIRNQILIDSKDDFVYVDHKVTPVKTFAIDYNRTFYRAFETRDISKLISSVKKSQASMIDSKISIFSSRYEPYFSLNYQVYGDNNEFNVGGIIDILPQELVDHIVNNELYTEPNELFKNIFVKYFNDGDILTSDISLIESIDFEPVINIYYYTLLLIFCVDFYTKSLLI